MIHATRSVCIGFRLFNQMGTLVGACDADLAHFRNRVFFGLAARNAAILELLVALDQRPMQQPGASCEELVERLALLPLLRIGLS